MDAEVLKRLDAIDQRLARLDIIESHLLDILLPQRKAFNRRTAHLVSLMRNPRGSGAERWWNLALYCGWQPSLKSWFCYIVNRESHGQPHAQNPSSLCYGLLQLATCHWAKYGRKWISDPENQLRLAWALYREAGASPWAL